MAKPTVSIRIDPQTRLKLEELSIELSGVVLKSYDDKINHLIWLYENQQFDSELSA